MKNQNFPCTCDNLRTNLRHFSKNGKNHLYPAAKPVKISNLDLKLLLETDFLGKKTQLFARNLTLYIATDDNPPTAIAETLSSPLSAAKISENTILVATETEYVKLARSNDSWEKTMENEYPAVRIFAPTTFYTLSAGVAKRKLQDSEIASSAWLGNTDKQNLKNDLYKAYSEILATAAGTGRLVQPVLARYKLFDLNDALLFVSCPVLLTSPAEPFPLTNIQTVPITDGNTVRNAFTLEASAYKPKFAVGSHNPRTDVAYMTIEMTPQIDPVNFDAPAVCYFGNTGSGTFLTFNMPGITGNFNSDKLIARYLENKENEFSTIVRIEQPFASGNAFTRDIECCYGTQTDKNALPETEFSLPHTFTSRHLCVGGTTLLHADITRKRFKGYNIIMCSHTTGSSDWDYAAAVTFRDGGEKVVCYYEGNTDNPLSLSPLLTYPSADAVEMTIYLRSGNSIYRRTFPLTPCISGNTAYYIEPGVKDITFNGYESSTFIVPAENIADKRYPGTAISTSIAAPLNPISVNNLSDSEITQLHVVTGGQTGWEQTRNRFYVFSQNKTNAAIYNLNHILKNVYTILSSGIINEGKTAAVPGEGLYCVSEGFLLKIKGINCQRIVKTNAEHLCYDPVHHELRLCGEETWILDLNTMEYYKSETGIDISQCSGRFISGKNGTYDTSKEDSGSVEITFRTRISAKDATRSRIDTKKKKIRICRSLLADIAASSVKSLKISINGDRGAGYNYSPILYSFTLDGEINCPILFHTPASLYEGYYITIQGSVSQDFELRSTELKFTNG